MVVWIEKEVEASIMEIGPRFIDPFPSKSHLDWPEIASKSQSVVRAQLSLFINILIQSFERWI